MPEASTLKASGNHLESGIEIFKFFTLIDNFYVYFCFIFIYSILFMLISVIRVRG